MDLELRIINDPYSELNKQRVRVFGQAGGRFGRALDNHWVLPDPARFLSGHHGEILYRNGSYRVRDTSRNGVFLNGSKEPLGDGRQAELKDGDSVHFGTYIVRVRLTDRHRRTEPSVEMGAVEPADATGSHAAADHTAVDTDHSAAPFAAEVSGVAIAPVAQDAVDDPADYERHGAADATGEHDFESAPALASTDEAPSPPPADRPVEPDRVEAVAEQPASFLATVALDPQSVRAALPRTVLIDRARLQAEGHLPPEKSERLIANQFRHIKRPVIKNAFGKGVEPVTNGRLVMVTSSLPGEGKTFSSINLALGIAREKGIELLLIDADVAKQHISRTFGVNDEPGLLDALADDAIDVESLVHPTDVEGLSILSAGQCGEDVATELLASSRMEEIAQKLVAANPHRIALFDTPPLLLTNESRVLASIMGQVLLVVCAGVTPRQAVVEAISYLDQDKPLGLVLNQSKAGKPGSYYGYGSYGYGGYGSRGEETPQT
jgi:exopolysaccharide/PEP-CTERM locus tyrosine autokinase